MVTIVEQNFNWQQLATPLEHLKLLNYLVFEDSQMGHFVMVSLWCAFLSTQHWIFLSLF